MGFFDKLLEPRNKGVVVTGDVVTIRDPEIAARLKRPEAPLKADAPQPPCESCKKPLREMMITTGGAASDVNLWREHPLAVDGWVCLDCRVFRYPRKMSPEAIVTLIERAIDHVRAGRHDDAEIAIARAVWDWPGYGPAHVNYGDAIRERLRTSASLDEVTRRRYERRMSEEFDLAMEAKDGQEDSRAHACVRAAEIALRDRAFDRARRALKLCLSLREAPRAARETAQEMLEYADQRLDLLAEATKVFEKRVALNNRAARPPESPSERKEMNDAITKLETHIELAPKRWESRWLLAKAFFVLERNDEGFAVFAAATKKFPKERALANGYAAELLTAERVSEAREVCQSIARYAKDDADVFANLATCELLSGDFDAARKAVDRSLELDEKHAVAQRVRKRVLACQSGKEPPKTMAALLSEG
ncbi:hypothetical protein BH09MYX1_BH09MYX1_23620 [soil metagenome]